MELAERLHEWRDMFASELGRNDLAATYWRESAEESYLCGLRALKAAEEERLRDPEVYEALLGAASRYFIGAQIKFVRAAELGQ